MSIFGKTKVSEKVKVNDNHVIIMDLVKQVEAELLSNSDESFNEMVKKHNELKDAFSFKCERKGDFLITETTNLQYVVEKSSDTYYTKIVKTKASYNISQTYALKFKEGNIPDHNGELFYYVDIKSPEGIRTWDDNKALLSNGNYAVVDTTTILTHDTRSSLVQYTTTDYPRHAKNDTIFFVGLDESIDVLAGEGQKVYEAILSASDLSDI